MDVDAFSGFNVLGFDTETTGLNPRKDRIVQYAFVGVDANGERVVIDSLVDPCMPIPPSSTRVHGITNKDVQGHTPFKGHTEVISGLLGNAVVVGHNLRKFDWKFLEMEYIRCGRSLPKPYRMIDTLELARTLRIPGRHTLGSLCSRYGIILDRAHSADADAAATLVLLWKILEEYPDLAEGAFDEGTQSMGSDGDLNLRDGDFHEGSVISFGKYSGLAFPTIMSRDPAYGNWLLSRSSPLEEGEREWLRSNYVG